MILKQRWFAVCTILVIFMLIVHQCDAAKRKNSSRKSSSDHDSKSRNGSKTGRTSSSSSSATQRRTEPSAPRHEENKTIGWKVQSVDNSPSSASKSRSSATQRKPIGWNVPSANNSSSSASKLSSSTTKKKPKTVGWNVPTANNSSSSATKKKPKTSAPRKEEKKITGNVQSEASSSSSKSKGSKVSSSTTKKAPKTTAPQKEEKKESNSKVKDFLIALINTAKDDNRGRSTTRKKTPKTRKNPTKAPEQNTEQAPIQAQTPPPQMPVYAGIPPPLPPPINQITDRDCVITMKLLNCSEIRLCPQGWLPPSCLQRTISKEYFDSVILPSPPTAAPINQITDLDCVYAMKILNCSEIRLCPQEWLHPACLHRTISKEYFDSITLPPPAPLPTMPVVGQSPHLSGPVYYDQNKSGVQAPVVPYAGVPLGNPPDSTNALVTPSPSIVAPNDKVTDLDCVYAMKILNCFEIRQCPQERLHPACLQRTISKEYFDSVTFPPPPSLLPVPEAGQGPIYSDQNKSGAQAQDVAIHNTMAVPTSFSPTPEPLPSSHSANSTESLVTPTPATPVMPQL